MSTRPDWWPGVGTCGGSRLFDSPGGQRHRVFCALEYGHVGDHAWRVPDDWTPV